MNNRTKQTTFEESLGRIRIKNTDSFTIPPYSIVAVGSGDNVTAGAMKREGDDLGYGKFVVDVKRPDARAIATGSPGQFLITTGASIAQGKMGYATATLPVWVEIDFDITERGTSVMPIVDQFKLFSGGGYFTVMDIKTKGSDKKYGFIRADHTSVMIRARTPNDGIDRADSGTTFPTAECELFHVIDDGEKVEAIPLTNGETATKVRVCNMSQISKIPGNIFIGITRLAGGAFAATWQDCD
jgi:hypothetical protein